MNFWGNMFEWGVRIFDEMMDDMVEDFKEAFADHSANQDGGHCNKSGEEREEHNSGRNRSCARVNSCVSGSHVHVDIDISFGSNINIVKYSSSNMETKPTDQSTETKKGSKPKTKKGKKKKKTGKEKTEPAKSTRQSAPEAKEMEIKAESGSCDNSTKFHERARGITTLNDGVRANADKSYPEWFRSSRSVDVDKHTLYAVTTHVDFCLAMEESSIGDLEFLPGSYKQHKLYWVLRRKCDAEGLEYNKRDFPYTQAEYRAAINALKKLLREHGIE